MANSGLERLFASETNLSDLLAYFTQRDPDKWSGVAREVPVEVVREGGAGTAKRADVLLHGVDGSVVAAVEVKLGHHLSDEQKGWYEDTFEPEVPLILASLDRTDAVLDEVGGRWRKVPLADLVARWTASSDAEVAAFAVATHRVLAEWSRSIADVTGEVEAENARTLSHIRDPFLARILTRTLKPAFLAEGAQSAYPGTTSGGGNAILQGWTRLQDSPEGEDAIAEVRWSPGRDVMDFRFGLDFGESSQDARASVWARAQQMDESIRADRFVKHLESAAPTLADLVIVKKSSGRPRAKGDWTEIVEHGFQRGDASHFNPGFYRDGDTRLQATARIDTSRATGAEVVALLGHALRYLAAGA